MVCRLLGGNQTNSVESCSVNHHQHKFFNSPDHQPTFFPFMIVFVRVFDAV